MDVKSLKQLFAAESQRFNLKLIVSFEIQFASVQS